MIDKIETKNRFILFFRFNVKRRREEFLFENCFILLLFIYICEKDIIN